jgi:hypothetical protein
VRVSAEQIIEITKRARQAEERFIHIEDTNLTGVIAVKIRRDQVLINQEGKTMEMPKFRGNKK